ncbi:ligand-binding sensor domain-containing protein [Filimonas lacunae]|nr:sensor histidine kinase [Filimonas lacunae]
MVAVFALTPLLAQMLNFRQYQVESGLSNNQVRCSMQDTRGFLWFGTPDGLNRFDGYTFKVFRNNRCNPAHSDNNNIRSLCEDAGGKLWVGTDRGLFHFDPRTESFRLVAVDTPSVVRSMKMDTRGNLWFVLGDKLHRLNSYSGAIKIYPWHHYFKATTVCFIGNQLWVGGAEGVLGKYNATTDSFTMFDVFEGAVVPDKNKWIDQLYATDNGDLLVGTATHGAKIFHPATGAFQDMLTYHEDNTTVFAKDFVQMNKEEYWIGTESSGIYVYNSKTGKVGHIEKRYNDPYALSDNSINTFCKDTDGGIWIGSNYGGLNYYSNTYDVFKKYYPKEGRYTLRGNVIREIHEDDKGNLWIGTEDGGLNKLDIATGRFFNYHPDAARPSIAYKNVHGMLIDGNDLWVGTYVHGLDILDVTTGAIKHHYPIGPDSNSLQSDIITAIYRSADQQIYLATVRGVYLYHRKQRNFSLLKSLSPGSSTCLFKDKNGCLWAGTTMAGLKMLNTLTGQVKRFTHDASDPASIGSGCINAVFCDSREQIWIATDGGLCRYNAAGNNFTRYTTRQGLPSNMILSMLEDNSGQLWIATSHGLACFSADSKPVRVYKKENGLLSDQFNYRSAFKAKDGTLYFGSLKGLVSFHPASFTTHTFQPPLYLTGIQVDNKELVIGNKTKALHQSISFTDSIVLKHHQSSFSIDFAALNYTAPECTEYAYKMEGLDDSWTYLKVNRKAYFTNLLPGSYRFKVKASAGGAQWSMAERVLYIRILPPWWLSPVAFLLYITACIALVVVLVKRYKRKVLLKNQRRMEQQELVKTRAMYEEKLHFFTNVAHEIKTPLTLIKGPMETVVKAVGDMPHIAQSLQIMDRNTNRLVELTHQLLDFKQTEIKGFSLSFTRTNVSELLKEAFDSFKPLATSRGLEYSIALPEEMVFAWIDAEAFNKITSNLFSNAVKYAESKVAVTLMGVEAGSGLFVIEISNDGFVIPPEMAERIFEPFFRLKETKKRSGTGIGLALAQNLAQLHNGWIALKKAEVGLNTFSLKMPTRQV